MKEDLELNPLFHKVGTDCDGKDLQKCDLIDVFGHPNEEVNGENYLILRRWEIGYDRYECIKEVDGMVRHIIADRTQIKKRR